MNAWRSLGLFGLVASFLVLPVCKADDADALKAKELVKAGTTFVLPVEQELADGMKNLRKLKTKVDSDGRQRKVMEAELRNVKNTLSSWEHQHRQLLEEAAKAVDIGSRNTAILKSNVLVSKLNEGNGYREQLEKKLNGLGAEEKTQFVNAVIDLGVKVDKAADQYKELLDDPEVKQALEKLNQPGKPKMKIGPSPEFAANTNMLKKWRGDVSSATVVVKHDNNVPIVEVTLNGTVVRELVVDSGASLICLTADLAKQLNMIPTDKDQTLHFKMANGQEVDAKLMTLKSVRVGQFTVTDVECAVLPATLVAAEPLLGGSFLNNFIYKMDVQAGEMHLAVIAGNPKVTTAGGDKKTGASKSTSGK